MHRPAQTHPYTVVDYGSGADERSAAALAIIRRDMQRVSLFQKRFDSSGVARRRYDIERFPLPRLLAEVLQDKGLVSGPVDLMQLHHLLTPEQTRLDASGMNEVSRLSYECGETFNAAYEHFVREFCVLELLGETAVFQNLPTIRFYFPRAEGFDWKLNYHTDVMLGHPLQEINFWIPFTRAYGANSMRIIPLAESVEFLRRYDFNFGRFADAVQNDEGLEGELARQSTVVEAEPGEAIAFDSRCLHVTQNNTTEHTRISMDFRILPLAEYEALEMDYQGTGRRKMPFKTGEYYSERIITVS